MTPRTMVYRAQLCLVALGICFLAQDRVQALPLEEDYALEFDGVTDFVALAPTASMMDSHWQDEKTVSLWVRPMGDSRTCVDVAHGDTILGDRPRWWGISRGVVGGVDRLWFWNFDQSMDVIGVDYSIGQWTHLALVHSQGVLHAFKDGVEVGARPSGSTVQPSTGAHPVLQIGGIIDSAAKDYTFQGQIDEVAIWNGARSATQIGRDAFTGLSGNEPGLVAYYRMSDGAGTTLTDNGPNGWTGTLQDGGPGVPADGQPALWVASTAPLADPSAPRLSRVFPQFADGTTGAVQFRSSLVLANTGARTAWITLDFYRTPDGAPMPLELGDLGTDSTFEFGLRQGETVCLTTPGTGDLQVGYARVLAEESVGPLAIFERLDTASGLSMYEAGVPAAALLNDFSIVVDSRGTGDTGLAVVHPPADPPAPADAQVRFRLFDQHFSLLAESTMALPAGSHLARYVYQLFEDPAVRETAREMMGTLIVHSDRPLAAVTVREKDDPEKEFPLDVPVLTTFPVIPGTADQP